MTEACEPLATPRPWVIERHDQEDGSITYEIWNHSPENYTRVVSLNDGCSDEDADPEPASFNAAFIIRACNSFNDLVKALEASEREYENLGEYAPLDAGCIECTAGVTPDRFNTGLCARHLRVAALAKARGEQP